jgi:hypothetical protein
VSLRFFYGPAGSGKTTCLMQEVVTTIKGRPLEDHQRVLALTKIHGSRRRLHGRLWSIPELSHRFDCMTADSYAKRLLVRWRSLSLLRFGSLPDSDDHDAFCDRAASLLAESPVSCWVSQTYPIIVVDEMQDSKGGQLRMLQKLSDSLQCLAAADDFQDLEAEGENEAFAWALKQNNAVSLSQNHRTNAQGLIDAALALREGRDMANGNGFQITGVPKSALGAWHVSKYITKWKAAGDLAIITPTGPDKSPFVREVITRIGRGPIGRHWTYGPHSIPWETSEHSALDLHRQELGLPDDPNEKVTLAQLRLAVSNTVSTGLSAALLSWFERKQKLSEKREFTVAEVGARIDLIQHQTRAFGSPRDQKLRAMTIHQAKNREFMSVIVLWPLEIQGSEEKHRRLLYNAVTRAKRQVLIVIQDPKNNRLMNSPFKQLPC